MKASGLVVKSVPAPPQDRRRIVYHGEACPPDFGRIHPVDDSLVRGWASHVTVWEGEAE